MTIVFINLDSKIDTCAGYKPCNFKTMNRTRFGVTSKKVKILNLPVARSVPERVRC
jgi:hypothetical protein